MKRTAEVFLTIEGFLGIISIVFLLICMGVGFATGDPSNEESHFLAGQLLIAALCVLLPTVLSFYFSYRLETLQDREHQIALGVIILIFCNIVSGVLVLAMDKDEAFVRSRRIHS